MKKYALVLFPLIVFLFSNFHSTAQNFLLPKEKRGKWGYTNLRGDEVIPYQFERAKPFLHSSACVKLNGKYGLIDERGKFLVEPSYDSLASKANAVVYAADGLYGIMDTLGQLVTEPLYQRVEAGIKDTLNVKRVNQWYKRSNGDETPAELADLVFSTAEEMPRFPGCQEGTDKAELKTCSETKMLQFIYGNIKYPVEARKNGVEGTVYVSFLITKEGQVTDIQIVRNVGAGTGEEAARIVRLMPQWVPGRVEGVPVTCKFNLPVKYRLE